MQKVLELIIAILMIIGFMTFDINNMYASVGCMWIAFMLFIGLISEIGRKEYE